MNQDIPEGSPCCEVCHCVENLKTCSRCHSAFYCRRDHQILHWEVHKRECKNFRSDQESVNRPAVGDDCQSTSVTSTAQSTANSVSAEPYATWCTNTGFLENTISTSENKIISPEQSFTEWDISNLVTQDPAVSSQTSSPASETSDANDLQLDNDFLDFAKYLFPGSAPMDYDLTSVTEQIFEDNTPPSPTIPANVPMQEVELAGGMSFEHVCNSVVHDLNVHGICVIDNFLGLLVGEQILREVKSLFQRGVFQKGQLVNSSMWKSTESIRGDLISWVSGTEVGCEYIGTLIKKLDDVMNHFSKMKDCGILSRYKLNKRTKAMVACYPGNGTHYKKHVDNPDGDGRCITCIYYLNKNWDVNKHGGLLRMFPTSHTDEVANINPEFDRMLFFWSDRRNPHEVLPSHAVRFAITVWYFDSDERQLALIKSSLQQKQ